jgi:hypothetical protein
VLLQVVIAVGVAAVAGIIALVVSRRTRSDTPTRPTVYDVPAVVDRDDFDRPDAPWLVIVFSSATCLSCHDVWEKARQLESSDVAVQQVEAVERKDIHDKYAIDAVPMTVVVDRDGVTQTSFLGVPSAADLWSAVAELRN